MRELRTKIDVSKQKDKEMAELKCQLADLEARLSSAFEDDDFDLIDELQMKIDAHPLKVSERSKEAARLDLNGMVWEWLEDEAKTDEKYGHISAWDVSEVTNMSGLLQGATSFNGDLSQWNTAKVSDMYGMFHGAASFNSYLNGWNTSNVTNMAYMFHDAKKFASDLSQWDVAKVTNRAFMFRHGAAHLYQDLLAKWNVSEPLDMHCTGTLSGHTSCVMSVAWAPEGNRLATRSYDKTVKLWDGVGG